VKGAMVYPAVIMSVAGLAIIILLWKVIPVFKDMFASVSMELPLPTRVVIGMSAFLNDYWWALGIGGVALTLFTQRVYATPEGKLAIDRFMLKLPVLGDVLRKSAVSRFTRTLGTLISSGVAILDGLEITARTSGNRVVQDAIMASRASIAGGDTIAAPLAKSNVFPPMVISMIAVGEQTGGLDEMLTKIADFYDDEVDTAVASLTSMIEPLMMVFLGGVVGGFLISMYLPIFSIAGAVK
jgi:type IV pilus assembly protein PilC